MLSSISTFEIFNTIVNHMTQARVVSANRQGNMGASVTIDEPCQTCVQSVKMFTYVSAINTDVLIVQKTCMHAYLHNCTISETTQNCL